MLLFQNASPVLTVSRILAQLHVIDERLSRATSHFSITSSVCLVEFVYILNQGIRGKYHKPALGIFEEATNLVSPQIYIWGWSLKILGG